MRSDLFFLVLFILYCLEAGMFLVLAPWNAGWDRLAFHVPWSLLRNLLLSHAFRGAVTGFGLVHLLWGLHDLRALFVRRRQVRQRLRSPAPPASSAPPAGGEPSRAELRDAG